MATLKITGLSQAKRALERLRDRTPESIVRPALHAAARPFVEAFARNSPQSRIKFRDVRATDRDQIEVSVEVRDQGTHAQCQALSRAYWDAEPDAGRVAAREIEEGIRRAVQ